ncbi:sugar 3,4-ketoisomerase [Cecembia rubra]|uniref:WxcM-like protein n=1 Tax=Cecembia rubra TaxID=1485585 RepID=A0A2P8DWB2_9BACT|nr:FdtA/QdtA family cupin domain-containing protein [Cecembia rubra]PSL01457.1 WxcM-like protein [Cecembia rubra]
MKTKLQRPELIYLHSHVSETGKLTFFEGDGLFPFPIRRSFWILDVPNGNQRGIHAHKEENQLLICLKGEVDVNLECIDGKQYQFKLHKENEALYLPRMTWSSVKFGEGAVLLVMSDRAFDEDDYLRDKNLFRQLQLDYLKTFE